MHIEEPSLCDRLRPDVIVVAVLRAGLKTASAGHTSRECIPLLRYLVRDRRPRPEAVASIEFDPSVDLLQMIEHLRAVDLKVADVREFRHRLKRNGVASGRDQQVVDQRRTGLPYAAVDHHRADAADLFKAAHVPDRRRRRPAIGSDRVLPHFHKRGDHVQIPPIRQFEDVPSNRSTLFFTPLDLQLELRRRRLQPLFLDMSVRAHKPQISTKS